MAGLEDTVAALARYRRLAGGAFGEEGGAFSHALVETSAWGSNPGALKMLSYAPADLPVGAPLVVALHGCSQGAQAYAEGAGWLTLADRCGFSVLCPEQLAANNSNRCFNWFQPEDTRREAGEALSIRQMVARALADHRGDSKRVFVTGLSAGGAMTAVMLATYPEVFAAGAIVAGLPYGAAANMQEAFGAMFQGRSRTAQDWGDLVRRAADRPAGPWPRVSIWHGDADSTVQPMNAVEASKQWTNVWGLAEKPDRRFDGPRQSRREWRDAKGDVVVEEVLVKGLAHGTPIAAAGPDGCGSAGPFVLEAGVSSSFEIARFWGLRPEGRSDRMAAGEVARSAPLRPTAQPTAVAASAVKSFSQVEQAITKALTTAGLIKGGRQS